MPRLFPPKPALILGAALLCLTVPALARGGGGAGGGGAGGGAFAGGTGHGPGGTAGHSGAPAHGGAARGGMHGGGHHHHPPFPIFFFGGFGAFGGFGYASPYYDPFYDGWYGPRLDSEYEARYSGDNVVLNVHPDHTSVYVNGMLYSSRGRGHFSLPSGDWTVELRAPGYLPQTVNLRVEQGVRYNIDRNLEKDRSRTPSGAPRKLEELSESR